MGVYGEKAFVNSGVIGRSSKARQLKQYSRKGGIVDGWVWGKGVCK